MISIVFGRCRESVGVFEYKAIGWIELVEREIQDDNVIRENDEMKKRKGICRRGVLCVQLSYSVISSSFNNMFCLVLVGLVCFKASILAFIVA